VRNHLADFLAWRNCLPILRSRSKHPASQSPRDDDDALLRDSEADLSRVAWYKANSAKTTHSVGQKESNAFGLYDMHGNVCQWCADWYAKDYYEKSEAENPQGLHTHGDCRVVRGSCLGNDLLTCRSTFRLLATPDCGAYGLGFRIVPAFNP